MALRKHALKSRACVAPALQPRSQRFGKSEVGLTHAQIASRRLARATVGYEVEADLGTFRERRKASPLDRRDMDEHILAAVIRLNKTIAFRGVEPFHVPIATSVSPRFVGQCRSQLYRNRREERQCLAVPSPPRC